MAGAKIRKIKVYDYLAFLVMESSIGRDGKGREEIPILVASYSKGKKPGDKKNNSGFINRGGKNGNNQPVADNED
jgi:hypothetical protein